MQVMDKVESDFVSLEAGEWFGLKSPILLLTVLTVYLLYVLKIGPHYMRSKPAYELKTFITVYNVAQLIACMYIVIETYSICSNNIFKFWICQMIIPNSSQEARFHRLAYFVYWLKMLELSETVVFVLRKKQNQISFLHVFHHCTTVSLLYILMKFYRNGAALYPVAINSVVHIFMYIYYLIAANCSKETLRRLTPMKKALTTIQMIQFVMILMQAFVLYKKCNIPSSIVVYYCIVVGVIFYGFYDFYKKSYTPNQGSSEPGNIHKSNSTKKPHKPGKDQDKHTNE